ncbi:MAG: DUF3168 domain-containing protein [Carnobacterium sp.]|uniref:tail completion protein gp17 n=1 Tax=Carnobacterium sp. TaxID=48221 RepID=UPI003C7149D3
MDELIASVELQKALFTLLTGDIPVYEIVPAKANFPYFTIKNMSRVNDNTKTEKRTEHGIYIHTWSKGNSSLESKKMNNFVQNKLATDFKVTGFDVAFVEMEMEAMQEEQKSEETIFHGTIEFRITLNKK